MSREEQAAETTVAREMLILSRRLRNGARDIYADGGLTFVEYSLLTLIVTHPGITAAGLAREAAIDKSTASRQLGELRRRGLLERGHGQAARGHALTLTGDAEAILANIGDRSAEAIAARMTGWTPDDVATFARMLHQYNNAQQETENYRG